MFTSLKKLVGGRAAARKPVRRRLGARPDCEALEARYVMDLGIGQIPLNLGTPSTPIAGTFTPAQVRHAYGFDQIPFLQGNYDGWAGQGETIAIVDHRDDPYIGTEMAQFDQQFGLPAPPKFTKVNQDGGSADLVPVGSAGDTGEIAMDVEWAHAIAPAASILLVEDYGRTGDDPYAAVDYARKQPGVVVVSMSFGLDGGPGSYYEGQDNAVLHTPAGHGGVTFVASSGDNGVFTFPAGSPTVLGVGGTLLQLNNDNTIASETAWSGSGGGVDPYEATPSYQSGLGLSNRGTPDVAYGAANFAVYSIDAGGWLSDGGTSAGAPQWSAFVALIDQGLASTGQGPLDGASQLLPALYQLPGSDFNDITSGSNKVASAGPGYDLVTGRGTPRADRIFDDMVYGFQVTLQNGVLGVNGNQSGAANNVITVNRNGWGGVTVTENGHSADFDPGQVSSVSINPGGGTNQVSILGVPARVAVNVSGTLGSNDSVTVGSGSLANVAGPVSVSNTSGKTALTIDDSADTANRMVTITNGSVQFSGAYNVSYSGQITALKVLGGSGNVGYFVNSTASATPLSLVTGIGQNSVFVGNGSLASIAAGVNVQANASGQTSLIVDDYKESGRNATVTSSSVTFTGVPAVTFSNISALTVVGSGGWNQIQVASVPSGVPVTIYNTAHNWVWGAAWQASQYYGLPSWDLIGLATAYAAGLMR
jgi:subtilase family serine protease